MSMKEAVLDYLAGQAVAMHLAAKDNRELRQEVREERERADRLQEEVHRINDREDAARQQQQRPVSEDTLDELAKLRMEKADLTISLEASRKVADERQDALRKQQGVHSQAMERLEAVVAERNQLQTRIEARDRDIDRLMKERSRLKQTISDQKSDLDRLEAELAETARTKED